MSSRALYDRPASAIAIAVGLVLVVVSVPIVMALLPQEHTYEVGWSQVDGAQAQANLAGAPQTPTPAALNVTRALTSAIVITVPSCSDNGNPSLHAAAQVTWTLEVAGAGGSSQLATDTLTCAVAAGYSKTIVRTDQPELAERVAEGADEAKARATARASVWALAGKLNETATYTLKVTWTRPAGAAPAGPLPLPGNPLDAPAPTATFKLQQRQWVATLNEAATEEVPR